MKHGVCGVLNMRRFVVGRHLWNAARFLVRLARNHPVIISLGMVIIVMTAYICFPRSERGPYLAYIGKYRVPSFDELHELALHYFLDEEPIAGRKVALQVHRLDTGSSPRKIYED